MASPGETIANAMVKGYQQGVNKRKGNSGSSDAKSGKTKGGSSPSSGGGNPWSILSYLPKLHEGGKVRKTGAYVLKKGEIVVPHSIINKSPKVKSSRRKSSSHKRTAIKA